MFSSTNETMNAHRALSYQHDCSLSGMKNMHSAVKQLRGERWSSCTKAHATPRDDAEQDADQVRRGAATSRHSLWPLTGGHSCHISPQVVTSAPHGASKPGKNGVQNPSLRVDTSAGAPQPRQSRSRASTVVGWEQCHPSTIGTYGLRRSWQATACARARRALLTCQARRTRTGVAGLAATGAGLLLAPFSHRMRTRSRRS